MANKFVAALVAGSQSVSVCVILRKTVDNTEANGKAAASVSAFYWRQGGVPTALTAASDLAAINSAWAAGGWKEAPSLPGTYRLDVDDAAFAVGADWVVIGVVVSGCYLFVERYLLGPDISRAKAGKNIALAAKQFPMFAVGGGPALGRAITVQRSIDGGAYANCTGGTPPGQAAEVGNGDYKIDLSAADRNGDKVMYRCTGTGCNATEFEIWSDG